jgi:hypothetical protein
MGLKTCIVWCVMGIFGVKGYGVWLGKGTGELSNTTGDRD